LFFRLDTHLPLSLPSLQNLVSPLPRFDLSLVLICVSSTLFFPLNVLGPYMLPLNMHLALSINVGNWSGTMILEYIFGKDACTPLEFAENRHLYNFNKLPYLVAPHFQWTLKIVVPINCFLPLYRVSLFTL